MINSEREIMSGLKAKHTGNQSVHYFRNNICDNINVWNQHVGGRQRWNQGTLSNNQIASRGKKFSVEQYNHLRDFQFASSYRHSTRNFTKYAMSFKIQFCLIPE